MSGPVTGKNRERTRARLARWFSIETVSWIRGDWPFLALEVSAIMAAGLAVHLTYRALQNQLLVNNWVLVTTEAPGNSGKVSALEFLASKGESLAGIDVSCLTMGGYDEGQLRDERVCTRHPFLYGLDLSRATYGRRVDLNNANFSETHLFEANLGGALLIDANLFGAHLMEANLSDTDLYQADFRNAQLSGANFSGAQNLDPQKFEGAWYWEDNPPRGLGVSLESCPVPASGHGHDAWAKPAGCEVPYRPRAPRAFDPR